MSLNINIYGIYIYKIYYAGPGWRKSLNKQCFSFLLFCNHFSYSMYVIFIFCMCKLIFWLQKYKYCYVTLLLCYVACSFCKHITIETRLEGQLNYKDIFSNKDISHNGRKQELVAVLSLKVLCMI